MNSEDITELHDIINLAEKENWTELDLSQDDIDFLPSEIGKLKNIHTLNLYGNFLETLPAEIGNLKNLIALKLGGNLLTELPQEICNLKNLIELSVDDNKLKFLPLKLGNLENLKYFSASENEIKRVPTSIGNLHQLETLYLDGNRIIDLPPSIGKLKGLQTLNISYNELKHLPDSILNLTNLRLLDISNNHLNKVPEIMLLEQLEELYINYNRILSPPIFYNKNTKLRVYSYEANLFDLDDVQSELPVHLRNLSKTQTGVVMNNSENVSERELLAREFESWQKQYYDDVYSLFEKRDQPRLIIAFNLWEDRFVKFLNGCLPRLVETYKTQTSQFIPLSYYGGSLEDFKPYKSEKVEAFLTQCIVDARKGNLDGYYIAPQRQNPLSFISTEKESNQKFKLKVFLCHSSNDKPQVRKLYKKLIDDDIDVWLDEKNLLPGQEWEYEIAKAIDNSDAIIICLSTNSVSKEGFVQKEIRFALDKAEEKPEGTIFIIPALLEECEVPQRLSKRHWVKLFEKNGYNLLIKALSVRAANLGLN